MKQQSRYGFFNTGWVILLLLSANSLFSHPFHDHSSNQALWHSLTGWDHWLAALAIGLWSANHTSFFRWLAPGLFLASGALPLLLGWSVLPPAVASATIVLCSGLLLLTGKNSSPLIVSGISLTLGFLFGAGHGATLTLSHFPAFSMGMAAMIGLGVGLALLSEKFSKLPGRRAYAVALLMAGFLILL